MFPRIFARSKWVLIPASAVSIYALALFPTAPVHFFGLFWPIPEWYMCLIYTSNTACTSVERSVCHSDFCLFRHNGTYDLYVGSLSLPI